MSATPQPEPMSLDEYYAYHPDDRRYELQAGFVLAEPHPGVEHGRVCTRLASLLDGFVRPRSLGFVFTGETGYLLSHEPPTVLIPDVGFVSFERGRAHLRSSSPFPGAPDLAVEVLSPSNRPAEMHGKVADYLAAGCRLVWVVDPKRETVAAYRTLLSPVLLGPGDPLEGGDVLPGFSVLVKELFEL